MDIEYVKSLPTELGNTHESVLRSYQSIRITIEMLKRGDSNKTILEILALLGYDS